MGLAVFRIAQLISVMTLFQTTTTSHKSTLTKWHTKGAQCQFEFKIQELDVQNIAEGTTDRGVAYFYQINNMKQI